MNASKSDYTILYQLSALGIGLLAGWRLKAVISPDRLKWSRYLTFRYKLVLVVSPELKHLRGRLVDNCASASILAYRTSKSYTPVTCFLWSFLGQPKVVVRANSSNDFALIQRKATQEYLSTCLIEEKLTNSKESAPVVMAVGPGPVSVIDNITRHFKLY